MITRVAKALDVIAEGLGWIIGFRPQFPGQRFRLIALWLIGIALAFNYTQIVLVPWYGNNMQQYSEASLISAAYSTTFAGVPRAPDADRVYGDHDTASSAGFFGLFIAPLVGGLLFLGLIIGLVTSWKKSSQAFRIVRLATLAVTIPVVALGLYCWLPYLTWQLD